MARLTAVVGVGAACAALLFSSAWAGDPPARKPKKGKAARQAQAQAQVAEAARALAGADLEAAAQAAGVLGADRSAQGLEALLEALSLGLHPQVAVAALDAVAARRSPAALDTLAHYARHRNAKVRARAIAAFGAIDDRRAEKHILAALRDGNGSVRAAAAEVIAARRLTGGVPLLMKLLVAGDEAAAPALAALATPDLARQVAETIGTAPDALVARCLGGILLRPDFKPDTARLEVVRALGRVPGDEALEQLTGYVSSIPENPPRASRREAETLIEARLGGGR